MSILKDSFAFLLKNLPTFSNSNINNETVEIDQVRLPECRYPLDNDSSAKFTLPDGRDLGYAEYGNPNGLAIFYLHGLPGSRLEAAFYHDIAVKHEARIIAVDRPGIGWSSAQPDRSLLDHARDIEKLGIELGLDKYSVLGVSGGGPYALACAKALPIERLKSTTIVCGLGPPDIGYSGMNIPNLLGFSIGYKWTPSLVKWYWSKQTESQLDLTDNERLKILTVAVERSKGAMSSEDFEISSDEDVLRLQLRSMRETFAQGYDGILQDGRLICSDFGFRCEDIRSDLPVRLLYGRQDTMVPLRHGEEIAARIGSSASLRVEDASHTGISFKWQEDVILGLLQDLRGAA